MIYEPHLFASVCRTVTEIRDWYLYTEIEGESFEYDTIHELLLGIIADCSDLGLKKAVVSSKISGPVSNSGLFSVIVNIGESGLKGLRLALVDADHHDLNEFGNLVAENRNIGMRFFGNLSSAELWLGPDRHGPRIDDARFSKIHRSNSPGRRRLM